MKKLTTEYLQGVIDAIYCSQIEILGQEIESEKDFNISATETLLGFTIELSFVESLEEYKWENDTNIPVYGSQNIFVNKKDKVSKIVKDVIAEMETIYNKPLPEVAELVEKE